MHKHISGTMIYYYIVCKRKLWYFYHDISMEHQSENVKIGKILDERTYQKEEKHININDVISIDFIKSKGILHEVKKSKKVEQAGIWQVKYYLFYLKQRGADNIVGKIDYPLLKQTIDVELSENDEIQIINMASDIENIVNLSVPPALNKSGICKACAYYELCFI